MIGTSTSSSTWRTTERREGRYRSLHLGTPSSAAREVKPAGSISESGIETTSVSSVEEKRERSAEAEVDEGGGGECGEEGVAESPHPSAGAEGLKIRDGGKKLGKVLGGGGVRMVVLIMVRDVRVVRSLRERPRGSSSGKSRLLGSRWRRRRACG